MMAAGNDSIWQTIEQLAAQSAQLFIKKLSRNDTSWADDGGKHQAGVYIPSDIRTSGFFPRLVADNPNKPHIFHADCPTFWPQIDDTKRSGIRHYSNKGPEAHFTVLPKELFTGLSPASLLLGGRLTAPIKEAYYWFVVIDSAREDAELLETALKIDADFHFGVFKPSDLKSTEAASLSEIDRLISEILLAIKEDRLDAFVRSVATLPSPDKIAGEAQAAYFAQHGISSLNPYEIPYPGDAIMRISRDIEYTIFKKYELRRRASAIVQILTSKGNEPVRAVVENFPALDAVFLSASQQRKSRAGRSFETHIAQALKDGKIRYQEQAILGGRRPDFVMPDKTTLEQRDSRPFLDALVLSAKTTLRERWKQVSRERFNSAIFLATVDDRVSEEAIVEMESDGIQLVVPESLKSSNETCYKKHSSVLTFRQFFDHEVRSLRPKLLIT